MGKRPVSTELLSNLILGIPPADPSVADPDFRKVLLASAEFHGVRLLLAHRLGQCNPGDRLIRGLAEICAEHECSDAVTGLLKEKELINAIDALASHGIFTLLIKGTPLAYSHYHSPDVRPRADTDILIPSDARVSARAILHELEYLVPYAESEQPMHFQFNAEKRDRFGIDHILDVHWKLSNHKAFAELFSYDELACASVPVSKLGPNARALGPVHALLLACMHRVAHIHSPLYVDGVPRYSGDRLIWLYDIHLLVSQMSTEQLEHFAALAIEKRIGAVCFDGVQRARHHFGTPLTTALVEALSSNDGSEPSSRYLVPGRLRHLLTELGSLPGWDARVCYLKQLALPGSGYLLQKYDLSNRLWLPLLYLHRGLNGLWKLASHTSRGTPSRAGGHMPAGRFE